MNKDLEEIAACANCLVITAYNAIDNAEFIADFFGHCSDDANKFIVESGCFAIMDIVDSMIDDINKRVIAYDISTYCLDQQDTNMQKIYSWCVHTKGELEKFISYIREQKYGK